jgi:hypothetical protein
MGMAIGAGAGVEFGEGAGMDVGGEAKLGAEEDFELITSQHPSRQGVPSPLEDSGNEKQEHRAQR